MSLENIGCRCPECGAEFTLDRAIGEQTLSKVQNEISKLSEKEIQQKVDAATKIAIKKGIPTIIDYFNKKISSQIVKKYGKAKVITATNVFAHIDNINNIVKSILKTLKTDGVFISESHYLLPLIQTVQYDTIYHEHLRYYSLESLNFLLKKHNLEIIDTKEIPTHGGSIRVYAARKGMYKISNNVKNNLKKKKNT